MALEYPIPRASSALAGNLPPTPEWYNFFRTLLGTQAGEDYESQIRELADRVAELEEGASLTFSIQGVGSVRAYGTPAGGVVQITLAGDVTNPGPTYRYGTGPDGIKGWFPASSAFAAGENVSLDTDPDTGVTTISAISGATPYFIPEASTFRVPEFIQSLFSMPIDCEGTLEVDGYLIGVD